MLFSNKLLLTF